MDKRIKKTKVYQAQSHHNHLLHHHHPLHNHHHHHASHFHHHQLTQHGYHHHQHVHHAHHHSSSQAQQHHLSSTVDGSTILQTTDSWLQQHYQPEPVTRCPSNITSIDHNDNLTKSANNLDTSITNLLSGFTSNTTIGHLYPEILSIIFSYLDLRDKGRVAQVCSAWKDAVYDKSVWKGVEAKLHLKRSNGSLLQSLVRRGVKKIQILSFQKGLKELTISIKNLERLVLTGCYNLSDGHLIEALSQEMPSLKQLSLGMCKQITISSITKIFHKLPNIELLDLGGCSEITDGALSAIRINLKRLKHLNLRSCRFITDSGISKLCLTKGDDYLNHGSNNNNRLYSNSSDYNNFRPISNNIKENNINGSNASDDDNESNCLTTLELLDLQDCQTLTDDSLKFISSGFRNLRSLNLSFCVGITDMGLKYLSSMVYLKEINLRSCSNITDIGLRYLSESGTQLTILDVSFCDKISDTGLNHISQGLTSLITLSLNSCSISDSGLIKLSSNLTNLKTLNIGQCNKITDSGVASLAENCHKLESIDLYGCTRITSTGYEKILQLPLLKYLNTGLWQDLQSPVYFQAINPIPLSKSHSQGCINRQSTGHLSASPYYPISHLPTNQYKNSFSCNDNGVIFRNCIVTKLCDSCQNVSFMLNPSLNASPLYIVLRLDKS